MYSLITKGSLTFRATAVGLAVAVTLFGFAFSRAQADVNPANCLANDFTTQLNKSASVAYDETNPNGATSIIYSVAAGNPQNSNTPPDGCNVDGVTVTLTTPDGVVHTLQTGGNYPVGTPVTTLGTTVTYVARSVDIAAGQLTASATATGALHDTPNSTDPLNSTKAVGVTVIHPNTTVTITPSVATTSAGASVNLTVTEHNTGDNALLNPSVTLTPQWTTLSTTSATFTGGDTGSDGILGVGETWTWVVPVTVSANTTYTAVGNGTDSSGNPVTAPNYQSEQASTTVHVLNTPGITTTLSATSVNIGTPVHDSAALTGATASAGGTATYTAYTDNECSVGAQAAGTVTVANGIVPDSNPITLSTVGAYYWQVAYSGDANNVAATSTCGSEVVTVGKFAPTISTTLSATNVSTSTPVHDSATLSGASADAGGTAAYNVFTDSSCSAGAMSAGIKTVTNGVVPDSDPLTFATPGTYFWQVTYSGDANNAAATSTCSREVLTVAAPPPPAGACDPDWKPVGIGYMDFGPIVNLNKNGRMFSANNPCPLTLPLRFSPSPTTTTTTVPLTAPLPLIPDIITPTSILRLVPNFLRSR